ncbi:MAG: hypothetical protein HFH23_08065 [Ruminococcus sp.]|nr:hypothetical protein [Ruminococcus sp.]
MWMKQRIIWKMQERAGMSVVELLLILVVLIALVLIFKNQMTNLVNTIFRKITSQSSGI